MKVSQFIFYIVTKAKADAYHLDADYISHNFSIVNTGTMDTILYAAIAQSHKNAKITPCPFENQTSSLPIPSPGLQPF